MYSNAVDVNVFVPNLWLPLFGVAEVLVHWQLISCVGVHADVCTEVTVRVLSLAA